MTVSGRVWEDGDVLYGVMLTAIRNAVEGYAHKSGGLAAATGPNTMKTSIPAATVYKSAVTWTESSVIAQEITHDAAHATYDRYDLIYTANSTWQISKGTAAANPVIPSLAATTGAVVNCVVRIPATATYVTDGDIIDCRIFTFNAGYPA
jgi:hypothetical protein